MGPWHAFETRQQERIVMDQDVNRRHFLQGAGVAAALVIASDARPAIGAEPAAAPAPAAAASGPYQPKPLPFDPKAIEGLSEKILVSHHDNNYVGAVKRLNSIKAQVDALDFATVPGFQL